MWYGVLVFLKVKTKYIIVCVLLHFLILSPYNIRKV